MENKHSPNLFFSSISKVSRVRGFRTVSWGFPASGRPHEKRPMDLIAILSGFGVGAIVGLTGVGGGSLMTPLLLTVFKLNPAVAIGTDLWFAAITKSSGAVAHQRHGHVDYGIVGWLLAGSIPASIATIAAMYFGGIGKDWAGTLTFALGIAL